MNVKVCASIDLKSKLLDRYAKGIEGNLGRYDRLSITGLLTCPQTCKSVPQPA